MKKKLKINKDKNIGKVVFLVEGDSTEPELIRHIFTNIFDYKTVEYDKRSNEIKKYESKKNKYSQVFVIPLQHPRINQISESKTYIDDVIAKLKHDNFFLDISNSAVYLVFDRDRVCNKKADIIPCLEKYTNSRDNGEEENGLLLISYPSIEAYIMNSYEKTNKFCNGSQIKKFLIDNNLKIVEMKKDNVLNATEFLLKSIDTICPQKYKEIYLDNLKEINMSIFSEEEKEYSKNNIYTTLSLFAISFLDLGLISFD
ncbi:MAG: hypothetical protein WCR40_02655 [Candidatus Paceibacterota bacterium]